MAESQYVIIASLLGKQLNLVTAVTHHGMKPEHSAENDKVAADPFITTRDVRKLMTNSSFLCLAGQLG